MNTIFKKLSSLNATTEDLYKQEIINELRKKYTQNDELAILRQRDTKKEEFDEYNAYVEECKQIAREKVGYNDI